jgi:hypothetical protein
VARVVTRSLSVVLDGNSYLERPRWHDGRLWASDFHTHSVVATGGQGKAEVRATQPNHPGSSSSTPTRRVS